MKNLVKIKRKINKKVKCGAGGLEHKQEYIVQCLVNELIDLAHRLIKYQISDVLEAARIMKCIAKSIQKAENERTE